MPRLTLCRHPGMWAALLLPAAAGAATDACANLAASASAWTWGGPGGAVDEYSHPFADTNAGSASPSLGAMGG